MTHHWARHRTRCHNCQHPGRHHRRLNARKPACECGCHVPPPVAPVRDVHRWPGWVDGDIEFGKHEVAS